MSDLAKSALYFLIMLAIAFVIVAGTLPRYSMVGAGDAAYKLDRWTGEVSRVDGIYEYAVEPNDP